MSEDILHYKIDGSINVHFTHIEVCGYKIPLVMDMSLPDDKLFLVTYNLDGSIREKVEVRIEAEIKKSLKNPKV
jgi:hypothetical protein